MTRDPLEYVLNRMEAASQSDDPFKNGYGPARKELLAGIAALRSRLALAEKVAKEVPFLLSVIASGETLSDEEVYYQREQLRALAALKEAP